MWKLLNQQIQEISQKHLSENKEFQEIIFQLQHSKFLESKVFFIHLPQLGLTQQEQIYQDKLKARYHQIGASKFCRFWQIKIRVFKENFHNRKMTIRFFKKVGESFF